MAKQIFDFISSQFSFIIYFMKTREIFDDSLLGFPVTLYDLTLGFLAVTIFLVLFGFFGNDDDVDVLSSDDDYIKDDEWID